MKIITERDRIRTVPTLWARQYAGGRNGEILAALKALDLKTASAAQIKEIIGNDSWTREFCSECDTSTGWTLMVGQEPDYDSSTAYLCKACAFAVAHLMSRED